MGHAFARLSSSDGPRVVIIEDPQADLAASRLALVAGRAFEDLPQLLDAAEATGAPIGTGPQPRLDAEPKLLSVVGAPRKILGFGRNYRKPGAGAQPSPSHPDIFAKFATALTGPADDIRLPLNTFSVDWESEMAIVFARRCRGVPAAEAAHVVLGYTAANDVTVREFEAHATQWAPGKTWDASTPLGPFLAPAERCGGVNPDLEIIGTLNGELVQRGRTSQLFFGVPQIVEYVTSFMTMEPGDVILTGSPSRVVTGPRFLKDGDLFEISIEGVGTLSNTFRDAPQAIFDPHRQEGSAHAAT